MASGLERITASRTRANSSSVGRSSTPPSASILSLTPKRISRVDQWSNAVKEKVVKSRPRLPPDFNHIFESSSRDRRNPRAFSLQQRVRSNGCAMEKCQSAAGADFL